MIKDLFKTPFARGNTVGFVVGILGYFFNYPLVWLGGGIILWTWIERYFFSKKL